MGTPKRKRRIQGKPGRSSLADALFTRTQQKVLGLLFGQPERSFGTLELIALASSGRGTVQRELERLVHSGLVRVDRVGPQRRYQANALAPIFHELRGIVEKTSGIPEALRRALEPLASKIALAVLFGSVAKASENALSDIDVLVVSDHLTLEPLYAALEPAERALGRRVSPTLYTTAEYSARRRNKHPFVTKVMEGKHVVLVGTEDGEQEAR
ncbi:MAG TPA: nucleotidyltransferase domain-containing protein [Kofleriaceae bacterium]|nr:nucleotidyltransferase domain-containing protein [Kofleriaceae bacterium]